HFAPGSARSLTGKMGTRPQLIEDQLDHMSPEENGILEAASVAGMEFSVSAVAAAISAPEEDVEACCTTLVRRAQFLQSRGSVAWPDGTVSARCGFVHALYQEVLYERVPPSRRGRLHQQIGTRLETGYATQTQEIAAELAGHFVQGADTSRAMQYLIRASENALQRSAYQEAMTHLTQGLDLLASLADTHERMQSELALQSSLGGALIAARGYAWPETGRAFARARELCAQLGEIGQLSTVQYGLCLFHLDRGEMIEARDVAEDALLTAQRDHDPTALLLSHRLVGTCHYFLGQLVSAREHLEQALSLYDAEQHRSLMFVYAADVRVAILSWLNRVLLLLGYPDQAHRRSTEALALAQELSHPHSVAYALRDSCFMLQVWQRQQVQERAEAVMSLAAEQGFAYELEEGRIYRGWALAEAGHVEAGIADIQRGIASYQAMGSEFQIPYFFAWLAQVYGQASREAEGIELIDEALDRVERTQERWIEAELYRLKGELLGSHVIAAYEEAKDCFHRASEIALQQNARLYNLRAAVSLARWLRYQGKPDEARQHLAPVYAGFTEGFDTPDLREAKELLKGVEERRQT
uniref:tetratricopeptide repeat protein n=1 Tax=Candidatus Entotheonella palauensis TaxID=93172 RepID=UPI001C4E207D